jgi:hypothetical protein
VYSEVKGVAVNLTHSPETLGLWGMSRSYQAGRRRCGRRASDECQRSPRGLRQHRVMQGQVSNQASDEQGRLGNGAMRVPEYEHQCKKRGSKGRVASDGDRYAATVSDEEG